MRGLIGCLNKAIAILVEIDFGESSSLKPGEGKGLAAQKGCEGSDEGFEDNCGWIQYFTRMRTYDKNFETR